MEILFSQTTVQATENHEGQVINYNFLYTNAEAPLVVGFEVKTAPEAYPHISGNYHAANGQIDVRTTGATNGALIDYLQVKCAEIVADYTPVIVE